MSDKPLDYLEVLVSLYGAISEDAVQQCGEKHRGQKLRGEDLAKLIRGLKKRGQGGIRYDEGWFYHPFLAWGEELPLLVTRQQGEPRWWPALKELNGLRSQLMGEKEGPEYRRLRRYLARGAGLSEEALAEVMWNIQGYLFLEATEPEWRSLCDDFGIDWVLWEENELQQALADLEERLPRWHRNGFSAFSFRQWQQRQEAIARRHGHTD